MFKTKMAFLEDRFLSSQSEQFKKVSKALIGWKKLAFQNRHFYVGHISRLNMNILTMLDSSQ